MNFGHFVIILILMGRFFLRKNDNENRNFKNNFDTVVSLISSIREKCYATSVDACKNFRNFQTSLNTGSMFGDFFSFNFTNTIVSIL